MTPEIARKKIDTFFNETNASNMKSQVEGFYDAQVVFKDPLVELNGVESLTRYYGQLYENIIEIRFAIDKLQVDANEAMFNWLMTVKHKRLKDGEPVEVPGMSHIKFKNDKAVFHRDYFDVSTMIYENVPVLGSLMRFLKGKVSSH